MALGGCPHCLYGHKLMGLLRVQLLREQQYNCEGTLDCSIGESRSLERVKKFLQAYRSTPHSATGFTPFSLMFGREKMTKLQQLDYL